MRDYSKTAPTFWTGETGRKIRAAGRDAQIVAFYLFTCPNSNWIGLYYLPVPTLCHEVGISREGALKALRSLQTIDYAYYDLENEIAWVPGSARFQIGESLKDGDNRIKGIVKDLQAYAKHGFARDFYRRYAALYHLPEIDWHTSPGKALASPFEGPPKPVTETEAVTVAETENPIVRSDSKSESPGQQDIFTELPVKGSKSSFPVTREYLNQMAPLYPGIDVEKETLRAKGWLLNNPKKGKTYDGMTRFLGHWFDTEQNKASKNNGGGNYGGSGGANHTANAGGPVFNPDELPDYARKK